MYDNSGIRRLRRWYRQASVRRFELVALGSTVLAFALTVALAGSGYAIESNGTARRLLELLGWVGAGSLALLGEGLILEGYRRLERGAPLAARVADRLASAIGRGESVARLLEHGTPRTARIGAAGVAAIGVGDVLVNLWVLSRVGVPGSLSNRLLGAIAIVALVAVAVAGRELLLEALRYQRAEIGPALRTAAFITVLVSVTLSGVYPFVGSLSLADTSAGAGAVMPVDSNSPVIWVSGATNTSTYDYETGTHKTQYLTTGVEFGGGDSYSIQIANGSIFIISQFDNTGDREVRRYESNGTLTWQSTAYSSAFAEITGSGSSYFDVDNVGTVAKVDQDGNTVYSKQIGPAVSWDDIGVQSTSDKFISLTSAVDNQAGLFRSDGTEIWTQSHLSPSATGIEPGTGTSVPDVVIANSSNLTYFSGSTPTEEWTVAAPATAKTFAWTDSHVFVGFSDGTVGKYDRGTGSEEWVADVRAAASDEVSEIRHGPNGEVYAATTGGYLANFKTDSTKDYLVQTPGSGEIAFATELVDTDKTANTYKQTFELDDRSGLFPPDRSTLVVSTWDVSGDDEYPSESEEWSQSTTAGFDHNNEATVKLVDGDLYKITVVGPRGDTWELIGYEANESVGTHTLSILGPPDTGTPTPTSSITPTPTATPAGTPFPTSAGTPTPTSGLESTGPVYLGECSEPGTTGGVTIEYWDPSYETASFDYSIKNDSGVLYEGTKTFSEPIGYYRGCVGENATGGTDPSDPSENGTTDYSGGFENGSDFSGSVDWPDAIVGGDGGGFGGGPVGSGSSSSAATWGGWLLLAGGGYVAYRRFGNGEIGRTLSSASGSVSSSVGRLFGR